MTMNYTIKIRASGNSEPTLLEGTYDKVMNLAHSLENFSKDVMYVEIWDEDCNTKYKWASEHWN